MNIAVCEDNSFQREQLVTSIGDWAYKSPITDGGAKASVSGTSVSGASAPPEAKIAHSLPTIHQYIDAKAFISSFEKDGPFDLAFLDIDLSGHIACSGKDAINEDGLHLARHIQTHDPHTLIVFVTSNIKYVFEGYKVQAFDFLPKPISLSELERVLDYASEMVRNTSDQMFLADTSRGMKKVAFRDIYYFKAQGQFVELHHVGGVEIFPSRFSDIIARLTQQSFISPHRSWLVNLTWVYRISKGSLVMVDGASIPIARQHQKAVTDAWLSLQ